MKPLAEITNQLTASPHTDGRSLQTSSPKVLDETAKQVVAIHVSQAFDIFNTYGKDAEALKSTYRAFEEDLAGYPAERIDRAFKEFRKENTNMPTPADILKILNPYPAPKYERPEYRILNGPDSDWKDPTEEEKEKVRKFMEELEEKHKPRKKRDCRPLDVILSENKAAGPKPTPLPVKTQEHS